MIKINKDFTTNKFYERFMIYSAIKKVIGSNTQISFLCVDSVESDNSDDPLNHFAGKFGNCVTFHLEDESYFMSVPSLHFESFYI